jgi:hypothetical protein
MNVIVHEDAARDLDQIFEWIRRIVRAQQRIWFAAFVHASIASRLLASLISGGQVSRGNT